MTTESATTNAEQQHEKEAAVQEELEIVAGAPKLAPFNPSSDEVVQKLIALTGLGPDDKLVDLGCGDGKVLLSAFMATGCDCVGVEYDKRIVERALDNVARVGDAAAQRVNIYHGDACEADLSDCTVIFMYLCYTLDERLALRLKAAHKRGVKIVSNMFSIQCLGEPTQVLPYSNGVVSLKYYHDMNKGCSTACSEAKLEKLVTSLSATAAAAAAAAAQVDDVASNAGDVDVTKEVKSITTTCFEEAGNQHQGIVDDEDDKDEIEYARCSSSITCSTIDANTADASIAAISESATTYQQQRAEESTAGLAGLDERATTKIAAADETEEKAEEETEMEKLEAWLDPLKNPRLLQTFDLSMAGLLCCLCAVVATGADVSVHVYVLSALTTGLFLSVRWFAKQLADASEHDDNNHDSSGGSTSSNNSRYKLE